MSTTTLAIPEALQAELRRAYAEPPRAYHHFGHVEEVRAHFESVLREGGWSQPDEVLLALLFHDAIYVAGASDNEARSAALAAEAIARHLPSASIDVSRVRQLVELTARHGHLAPADVDGDAALFLDCDMAILGAAPERFDDYDRAIAEEYAAVPRELFDAGRRRFLEALLASERIFLSERFHRALDGAARSNLRRRLGVS